MLAMPAQEIKRRGIGVLNASLAQGPVWLISNNRPKYVVMLAEDFKRMRHDAFVQGVRQSESEYQAGLGRETSVAELMTAFED